jgi:DNA-binding beta-propeller fold protein YncE
MIAACSSPDGDVVSLPNGSPGIGFDDLRWSAALGRVIVPAGRSGEVVLIDPETKEATAIEGFSATPTFEGGHDDGPTSADEGAGFLFVTDRTSATLAVVDPKTRSIVTRTGLSANPDYVRFVAPTNELWVTEPAASQIELFAFDGTSLRRAASIAVAGGPESLVIDALRGRAYTHEWKEHTVAIDVRSRAIVGRWQNGCAASRGIELDAEHGFVLAACSEGTVTVLDAANDGHVVDALAAGAGYDVMGWAEAARHVYVAGTACGCLTVLGLSRAGKLDLLGRFDAPGDTHCVVADDRGHAFVCAPSDGALLRVKDDLPWR